MRHRLLRCIWRTGHNLLLWRRTSWRRQCRETLAMRHHEIVIRTLLFEMAAILSKHTGRARDSMQALWSRLKEGGKQVAEMSWDLEEGRHSTSEVVVEDVPHSANLSLVLAIPTPVTPYGPTPPSPLSDFVWRSPALSSQPAPLMGPHHPPLCLIWCGVHQHLMKIPLPVSTWLHFGLVGKRQRQEIF